MIILNSGLDAAHLRLAITTLAKFHAVGLSIKHKRPDYLSKLKLYGRPMTLDDEIMGQVYEKTIKEFYLDDRCSRYVDRIRSMKTKEKLSDCYYTPLNADQDWCCIVHGDFWLNNALFCRNDRKENAEPIDAKIVDFQTYYLGSPLTDLVFLLCTSMERRLENFDEAIELYRKIVEETLRRELSCDDKFVDSMLSRKNGNFDKRLKIDARKELIHVLLMAKVVELEKDEDIEKSPMNEVCLSRITRILNVYEEKNWI